MTWWEYAHTVPPHPWREQGAHIERRPASRQLRIVPGARTDRLMRDIPSTCDYLIYGWAPEFVVSSLHSPISDWNLLAHALLPTQDIRISTPLFLVLDTPVKFGSPINIYTWICVDSFSRTQHRYWRVSPGPVSIIHSSVFFHFSCYILRIVSKHQKPRASPENKGRWNKSNMARQTCVTVHLCRSGVDSPLWSGINTLQLSGFVLASINASTLFHIPARLL